MDALDTWHDVAANNDVARLDELIDQDAVFESPIVHRPQIGRDLVVKYLAAAMRTLGGPDFRYTGQWRSDDGAVLEFETQIDGIAVNGVDILRFTPDGRRIAHFKVMLRPLKAIDIVHRKMAEALG